MRIGKNRSFCGALAALAFGGVVFSAAQSDAQFVHPGVECDRISGGTYGEYFGTVVNSSTGSDMRVLCPLVNRQNDFVLDQVVVRVTDRHSSLNVQCTVNAVSISGSTLTVNGATIASTGSSATHQILNFVGPYSGTSHYADCTIPRAESAGVLSHLIYLGID